MDELKKRISYVKGLADGYNISAETKEGRVITEIISVLGDMVEDIEELMYSQAELEDYVETLDEDLGDLEEDVYEELDGDYETYDDEEEYYDTEELDEDGNFVEMECPHCQEEVYFDSGILDDDDVVEVVCPNCEEVIFVNDQDSVENRGIQNRRKTEDI